MKHLKLYLKKNQTTYDLRSPLKNCKVLLHRKSPSTDHLTYIVFTAINEVDLPLKLWKIKDVTTASLSITSTYLKCPFL